MGESENLIKILISRIQGNTEIFWEITKWDKRGNCLINNFVMNLPRLQSIVD